MKKIDTPVLIIGAAALAYYLYHQQTTVQAAPLSIYPSLAWTAQPATTSMASSGTQKASTVVAPESLYTSAQNQAQAAIAAQCVGSYPACTPLTSDTQLGF